jgi:hypothetical protein
MYEWGRGLVVNGVDITGGSHNGETVDVGRVVGSGVALERVRVTGVGLQIPMDLSFEAWERTGRQLSGILDSSAWWLGDWLVFGKKYYPDRYQRAIQAVGLRYQTLRNYAWVARRFDLDHRRLKLTFQHHAEVASLPVEERERLLDQAEVGDWTTKQLRHAMREALSRNSQGRDLVAVSSRIAVPHTKLVKWRAAANSMGVEFDRWMWSMLDRAADEILSDDID